MNIVLLPVQGGVGLNDDALARGLLDLFDQRRFVRLERLSNLRVNAEAQALGMEVRGHFTVGAELAQHPFERLLAALARAGQARQSVKKAQLQALDLG